MRGKRGIVMALLFALSFPASGGEDTDLRRDLARLARTAAALETRALRAEAALARQRSRAAESSLAVEVGARRIAALEQALAEAEARAAAQRDALDAATRRAERSAASARRAAGLRRIDAGDRVRFILPEDFFADEAGLGRRLDPIHDALQDRPGAAVRMACHWDAEDRESAATRRCRERLFLLRNAMTEEGMYSPPSADRIVGAGEPLSDARDRFGKEANRRIEVELVPQGSGG